MGSKLFWAVVAALIIYYLTRLTFTPVEVVQYVVGIILLWAPITVIVFVLLNTTLQDTLIRIILALIVSYTLTTLIYFLQSIIVSDSLLLLLVVLYGAAGAVLAWKFRDVQLNLSHLRLQFKPDKTLLFLIILS